MKLSVKVGEIYKRSAWGMLHIGVKGFHKIEITKVISNKVFYKCLKTLEERSSENYKFFGQYDILREETAKNMFDRDVEELLK